MASPIPDSPGTMLAVKHEQDLVAGESCPTPATLDTAVIDDHDLDAAKEELKHTSISDKTSSNSSALLSKGQEQEQDRDEGDKEMGNQEQLKTDRTVTPESATTDAADAILRERITSPKKKRGRETEDDVREISDDGLDSLSDGPLTGKRAIRSGPEKKRPRDASVDPPKSTAKMADMKDNSTVSDTVRPASPSSDSPPEQSSEPQVPPSNATLGSGSTEKGKQTSASAFANSGFASLSSSTSSPFGTVGASKPSVFGSSASIAKSGFGGFGGSNLPTNSATITSTGGLPQDKPALGFGFGSSPATTSGFGALKTGSLFGSGVGNGFGGGSGPKLATFAAPLNSKSVTGGKPTKAFGAPESDEEEGSGDDDSNDTPDTDEEDGVKTSPEDKKKNKANKVEDGESGEATLLQLRAKLFALESKDIGWKERGVGTLKINVPEACVRFDRSGIPLPGSFDKSMITDDAGVNANGPRVPRLIMRQENTHRVVLNTIIVPAMDFKDKPSQQAAQILFTALEGEKEPRPISMLLKMSENNAHLFRSEIKSIQNQL